MLMTLMGCMDLEMKMFFRGSEAEMLQVYADSYRLAVPTNILGHLDCGHDGSLHDPPPGMPSCGGAIQVYRSAPLLMS